MSYLLDKKIQRKKFLKILLCVFVLLILIYFRSGIFNKLSYASQVVFHPILVLGNNLGEKFSNAKAFFISKNSLYRQNEDLQSQLKGDEARMSNYNSILAENIQLKEILGRKKDKTSMVLGAILSKPNQSLYDTLVIDAGAKQGLQIGDMVFAAGVPIGRVAEVYGSSSKIILFSSPGEKTQVVINKNVFMQVVGRGGGNFEMVLPRDFTLAKGDQVVLPGLAPNLLGIVQTIISDPRDPFVKALLTSPVNVQELKFVEVERQ